MDSTPIPARELSTADGPSLVGSTLGNRYRILELLGEGGVGYVFRATQLATNRIVALKLLRPELGEINQIAHRFAREAELTKRLAHPNIVDIVEFGEINGRLFLAMEFLAGRSLADLLENGNTAMHGRLTVERTLAIMRQVLRALEHAHSRGIMHRDLKPENIMVLPARGPLSRERVKLLDFGIAKLTEAGAVSQKLTQAGLALGTPRYMSPEQAIGKETDARSDLYSCGVILYETLTGQAPFESASPTEVLTMHVTATPRPLRTVAPSARISAAIETVVLRALAKEPAQRFQSARELCVAFERAAKVPDQQPDTSGLRAAALALAPARASSSSRWLLVQRLILALLGAAILVADHCHVKRQTAAATNEPPKHSPIENQSALKKTKPKRP
jgi:serine/threonine-protein kinase